MKNYPIISLLSAWPTNQQEKFIGTLKKINFGDQEIIFEKDDASTDAYFILQGSVKSLNYNSNGKISYFRIRHAGDCFGYYSAISEQPRTATMIAIGSVVLARMSSKDFFALLATHPEINKIFLKLIVGILRIETDRLTNLTTFSTHQRVAAELLSRQFNREHLKIILPDRVEFASYLGMTRETLSRSLNHLCKKKLINLHSNIVTIVDHDGLESFLEKE